ncbi:hypothetical protein EK21DRAFT_92017 [Setomelanomma holmii]|uniref:Uncharacterized protein n=1 Tax=Setomelanomma holmii TaxID=210430 RepID=A0A9P4H2S7_9PLEO|nr:hypothetical protein EK21DRAFT_92017 [Setomelanomma holmii]
MARVASADTLNGYDGASPCVSFCFTDIYAYKNTTCAHYREAELGSCPGRVPTLEFGSAAHGHRGFETSAHAGVPGVAHGDHPRHQCGNTACRERVRCMPVWLGMHLSDEPTSGAVDMALGRTFTGAALKVQTGESLAYSEHYTRLRQGLSQPSTDHDETDIPRSIAEDCADASSSAFNNRPSVLELSNLMCIVHFIDILKHRMRSQHSRNMVARTRKGRTQYGCSDEDWNSYVTPNARLSIKHFMPQVTKMRCHDYAIEGNPTGDLTNPIHAMFASTNWPMEQFTGNSDSELWKAIEPVLRLASRMITSRAALSFFRRIRFGLETPCPPGEPLKPPNYVAYTEPVKDVLLPQEKQVREDLASLAEHIQWAFGAIKIPSEPPGPCTHGITVIGHTEFGKTIFFKGDDSVLRGLKDRCLTVVLNHAYKDFIQKESPNACAYARWAFSLAFTMIHEIAHAFYASIKSINHEDWLEPLISLEQHDGTRKGELGMALEAALFKDTISTIIHPREGVSIQREPVIKALVGEKLVHLPGHLIFPVDPWWLHRLLTTEFWDDVNNLSRKKQLSALCMPALDQGICITMNENRYEQWGWRRKLYKEVEKVEEAASARRSAVVAGRRLEPKKPGISGNESEAEEETPGRPTPDPLRRPRHVIEVYERLDRKRLTDAVAAEHAEYAIQSHKKCKAVDNVEERKTTKESRLTRTRAEYLKDANNTEDAIRVDTQDQPHSTGSETKNFGRPRSNKQQEISNAVQALNKRVPHENESQQRQNPILQGVVRLRCNLHKEQPNLLTSTDHNARQRTVNQGSKPKAYARTEEDARHQQCYTVRYHSEQWGRQKIVNERLSSSGHHAFSLDQSPRKISIATSVTESKKQNADDVLTPKNQKSSIITLNTSSEGSHQESLSSTPGTPKSEASTIPTEASIVSTPSKHEFDLDDETWNQYLRAERGLGEELDEVSCGNEVRLPAPASRDFSKDIHPIFAPENWPLEDFANDSDLWKYLMPALQLASKLLTSPASLKFFRRIKHGVERVDHESKRTYLDFTEDEDLVEKRNQETLKGLEEVAPKIKFLFGVPKTRGKPGHETQTTPNTASRALNLEHSNSSVAITRSCLTRKAMRAKSSLSKHTRTSYSLASKNPCEMTRFAFSLGYCLHHELGHAYYTRDRTDKNDKYTEPF